MNDSQDSARCKVNNLRLQSVSGICRQSAVGRLSRVLHTLCSAGIAADRLNRGATAHLWLIGIVVATLDGQSNVGVTGCEISIFRSILCDFQRGAVSRRFMADLAKWDWSSPELPVDNWWFFAVVLIVLIFFIWMVARLTATATDDTDPAEIDRQMLTAVSELRSRGEITQEEFRSIKSRLVVRLADETRSNDSVDLSPQDHLAEESKGTPAPTTETQGTVAGPSIPHDSGETTVGPETETNQKDTGDTSTQN